jgi:ketosteroid isomerase-like protein
MSTMTASKPLTLQDLNDLFDAFNRHDIDAVMAYFADDAVFDAVGGPEVYGTRILGRAAIKAAFENVFATMPDAHWAHRDHLVQGDRAISEWTFSGTNPDGTRIEAEGADLFHLKDGRIVHKQAFRKQRPPVAKS